MKRLLIAAALVTGMAGVALADAGPRDPVGETAHYVLDRNSQRTTSMIQAGLADITVTRAIPENKSFETSIAYDVTIMFMGHKTGTEIQEVPEEYFTPEFMVNLRQNGVYESEQFKVKHLGYKDARNMDGRQYPHCDYILIYDIDTSSSVNAFVNMAIEGLRAQLRAKGVEPGQYESIENLQIWAHIKEGLPVIGAVKIDAKGDYSGQPVKAGVDYMPPN